MSEEPRDDEGRTWDPQLHHALLHGEEVEWQHFIPNLDAHFSRVYGYFVEKGFWCIIVSRVMNLITLAFTILFSTFLLLMVNWPGLVQCMSEETCAQVVGLRQNILSDPTFGEVLVTLYFGLFSLYWVWHCLSLFNTVNDALEMRSFYSKQLNIADEQLGALEWCAVVDRIVKLRESKKIDIYIVKKDLTALDVTNFIMRKENYLIAMINLNVLDFRLPFASDSETAAPRDVTPLLKAKATGTKGRATYTTLSSDTDTTQRIDPPSFAHLESDEDKDKSVASSWFDRPVFGKALEWNLQFFVINSFFGTDLCIKPVLREQGGERSLRRRFVLLGLLNLLLLPFTLIFMLIFFFLKNAEELHSKKTVLGPRQWSPYAMWKFREFNELPHFFQKRLNQSYEPAQKYVEQFPVLLTAIVAQACAYISGAVVAVLLLLTFTDSTLLLYFRVFDMTLLWYLALFSAFLALSRAFIPEKHQNHEPQKAMLEVVRHTHYLPRRWRLKLGSPEVLSEFGRLYKPRVLLFLDEVLCVILTPFVLCFVLPRCALRIVEFLRRSTVRIEGVGDVCGYALFDLSRQDPSVNSPYSLSPASDSVGGGDKNSNSKPSTATAETPKESGALTSYQQDTDNGRPAVTKPTVPLPTTNHGKAEKSLLSFAVNHPNWKTDATGARFLDSVFQTLRFNASGLPLQSHIFSPNDFNPTVLDEAALAESSLSPGTESKQPSKTEPSDSVEPPVALTVTTSGGEYDLSQSAQPLIQSFSDLTQLLGGTQSVLPQSVVNTSPGSSNGNGARVQQSVLLASRLQSQLLAQQSLLAASRLQPHIPMAASRRPSPGVPPPQPLTRNLSDTTASISLPPRAPRTLGVSPFVQRNVNLNQINPFGFGMGNLSMSVLGQTLDIDPRNLEDLSSALFAVLEEKADEIQELRPSSALSSPRPVTGLAASPSSLLRSASDEVEPPSFAENPESDIESSTERSGSGSQSTYLELKEIRTEQ